MSRHFGCLLIKTYKSNTHFYFCFRITWEQTFINRHAGKIKSFPNLSYLLQIAFLRMLWHSLVTTTSYVKYFIPSPLTTATIYLSSDQETHGKLCDKPWGLCLLLQIWNPLGTLSIIWYPNNYCCRHCISNQWHLLILI